MPLGVLREPAPEDAFLLLKHLSDAPEAREGESAQDGGDGLVGNEPQLPHSIFRGVKALLPVRVQLPV